jgi:hypothetical protein
MIDVAMVSERFYTQVASRFVSMLVFRRHILGLMALFCSRVYLALQGLEDDLASQDGVTSSEICMLLIQASTWSAVRMNWNISRKFNSNY